MNRPAQCHRLTLPGTVEPSLRLSHRLYGEIPDIGRRLGVQVEGGEQRKLGRKEVLRLTDGRIPTIAHPQAPIRSKAEPLLQAGLSPPASEGAHDLNKLRFLSNSKAA